MNKVAFVCPYFGKLPKDHMSLFLQSCRFNENFDWLIITDDTTNYEFPKNVKVIHMSFDDCRNMIQSKFDFPISLNRPYKLCDFKVTYGYVFSEIIKGYKHWGYCDISDSIFGDLKQFVTDDLLGKYDKIGVLGHLTIFKNTAEVNDRFREKVSKEVCYRDVLSCDKGMNFDELGHPWSINSIYKNKGIEIGRIDDIVGDIHPDFYCFTRAIYDTDFNMILQERVPRFYRWVNGKLIEYSKCGDSFLAVELAYIHLQRRMMRKLFTGEKNDYLVIPNEYIETEEIFDVKRVFSDHKWNNLFYAPIGCNFLEKLDHIRGNFSEWIGIRVFLKKRRDRRRKLRKK